MERRQFNVTLPADLVRRLKHRAVDEQLSLSDFVERALEGSLAGGVRLQPMVHVADMAGAVDFFTALGARVVHGSRDGDWTLVALSGGGEVGLLAHPPNPEQDEGVVELNFAARALDALEERVVAAGVEVVRPTGDEAFGRQLQLRGPDGRLVKVNELEPPLFT